MFTNTGLSSSLNQIQPYQYQDHGLYLEGDKKSHCLVSWTSTSSSTSLQSFIIPTPVHMHINSLLSFYLDGYDTTLFFGGVQSQIYFCMAIFAFINVASWKYL